MDQALANRVWLEAIEKVKDVTLHPSLWRALEASHGITMDGDHFVVGFTSQDYPQAGMLRSAEYKTIIEKILTEMTGNRQVRVKTIEGTTFADFQNVKHQEEIMAAQRTAMLQKKATERIAGGNWESVLEGIAKIYASRNLRQLPQIRAQFMNDALKLVSEAMDRNYGKNPDDATERALARVIDKVAALADAPAVWVATELWRMREGN